MTPKAASKTSIILFIAWVIFNLIMTSMGLVSAPWYKQGMYSIVGIILAILSSALGLYARVKGKTTLDKKSRDLALIPVIGGASFLFYFLMSYLGIFF